MVTCGGQATIPIVAAVSQVGIVSYAEIVASISSKSAGPGTRANIDEFTETTAAALRIVGGAQRGKAIIDPQPGRPAADHARHRLLPGATVTPTSRPSSGRIEMVGKVQTLRARLPTETAARSSRRSAHDNPLVIPETGKFTGTRVTALLEVDGAAHYLPAYAGNLDIMTSAALAHRRTHRQPCHGQTARSRQHDCTALHPGRHPARRHARHSPPVHPRAGARPSRARSTPPGSTPSKWPTATGWPDRRCNYGFGAHTDLEWIEAVADVVTHAKLATLLLPGIGTRARPAATPTAPACTVGAGGHPLHRGRHLRQHIAAARELGMDTVGFLMMSHMTAPDALAEQAKLMETLRRDLRLRRRLRRRDDDERRRRPRATRSAKTLDADNRDRHPRPPQPVARRRQLHRRRRTRRRPRRRLAGGHGRRCGQRPAGGLHRRRRPHWAGTTAATCSRCRTPPTTSSARCRTGRSASTARR